jgi:hypothetical protein
VPVATKKRKRDGPKSPTQKALLRFLKRSLSNDFPNPKRIGCPQVKALQWNARNPRDADETVSKHVGRCSPCYQIYTGLLRKEIARMRRKNSHRMRACSPQKKSARSLK